MVQRVLVVDDEPKIRAVLRSYLEAEGFVVSEADTGEGAVVGATTGEDRPSLVLLDIGLPDVDGLEVLRRIRSRGDVPVILVTARAEEVDTLVGLRVGADDYVTKPFSPREVVARVHTVLRRARPPVTGVPADAARADDLPGGDGGTGSLAALRFDGLRIDPDRHEISRLGDEGWVPVQLSALEFELLVALARSPGRVYSRAQLLEQVWGYDFYGDERVVDVHVASMRRALGDDAGRPTIIGTVRGVGYRFVLPPVGSKP
ncbi:response regulator transcription factor [Terrabacter sp. LjRoot27]|uniref:response regulator transcription factor n=1 Tax=Terrabacter sp. LjRoot27 TaxID=3342306 RepID=UPI003ECE2D1A